MSIKLQRIFGHVAPHEFVGRRDELARIVAQATSVRSGRGLLVLMEPSAGVSELLRQSFDQIFSRRGEVVPIYFAFTRSDATAVSASIEFLNAFLQQYIAYRRNEPALCRSPLTLQDLVMLAPAADLAWVEQLVESYSRLRFSNDDKALVRFCLAAPQRIPAGLGRAFVMLDGAELAEKMNGSVTLGKEVLRVFGRAGISFVLAGLRRQVLQAAHDAECDFDMLDVLRLERLEPAESRLLVERVAERLQVLVNEEARDLIVQQFSGSPLFITNYLQAAREKGVSLNSFLACERLYVDEILGGHISRHFRDLVEQIAPVLETRQNLMRLLWEGYAGATPATAFETWRKRLHTSAEDLESILYGLHVQEFVNWNGATVETARATQPWRDYLKFRYRLDARNEQRVLVVAEALTDVLKRAPGTMARHYKQAKDLGLRDLLSSFDCQRVPAVLFDYQSFRNSYRGESEAVIGAALEADTNLKRLPQSVHVATSQSFSPEMAQVCEEEKCVVAHCFEDGAYGDAQEMIWLAVELESKLEVDEETAQLWCERLESLAARLNIDRYQVWLIAGEGFADEASRLVKLRGALTSNRAQVEMLSAQVAARPFADLPGSGAADEYLMVVPMSPDNELIAANTVEHIARKMSFKPEAINQIKTAIVEACINAAEHSFSPDRKIYQRFRVESDRLVITISSRGVAPVNLNHRNIDSVGSENDHKPDERRGWGINLIRNLMDEVEFERVDDGTSLKMTKYHRNNNS